MKIAGNPLKKLRLLFKRVGPLLSYHSLYYPQPPIVRFEIMNEFLKRISSGEVLFVDLLLYSILILYFAWICRRETLAKMKWGFILVGTGCLFGSAALYFVQFDLLRGINSSGQIKWLSVFALAFVALGGAFFAWEFISKKASSPPLRELLTSVEKRKFWIELTIGFVLAALLILRRKFW